MQKAALGIVVRRPFPLLWMSVYTTLEIVGFVQELGEWSDAAEENMKKITEEGLQRVLKLWDLLLQDGS